MMAVKGRTNNPNGRPKGTHNRSTETAKLVMAQFVGKNLETMQELFEVIKVEDPKKAFDVLLASLEYVLPKLARQELTGRDGKDFNISWPLPKTALDIDNPTMDRLNATITEGASRQED